MKLVPTFNEAAILGYETVVAQIQQILDELKGRKGRRGRRSMPASERKKVSKRMKAYWSKKKLHVMKKTA